jgi:hypothetical protein
MAKFEVTVIYAPPPSTATTVLTIEAHTFDTDTDGTLTMVNEKGHVVACFSVGVWRSVVRQEPDKYTEATNAVA